MTLGRVFPVLVGVLVAVGVVRPALPELLRNEWPLAIALLALTACVFQLWRCRRHGLGHEATLTALLPLVLGALYLQPQRVASDGIFYYAPLRSLVVDGDLDFENEYRVLGARPGYFQRTVTGRLPNNYSVGPAIAWLPFFLGAHALGLLGLYRPTGFGYPYFTAIATGTAVAGFVGVVFVFRLLRVYFPSAIAFTATVFVWLASFHIWYMVFEPSMSHAMAMASVALFLWRTQGGLRDTKDFAWAGVLGGIAALIRWQNVVFLPVGLAVSWSKYGRPKTVSLVAGAAAFALVFTPQLLYWKSLYGGFLLIPQGGGYIDWARPELMAVLFSSRHGLLAWAPLLWLGVLGFPGFFRREPVLAGALALATMAAWYVNASVFDWWVGASFGSRRFDGAIPGLALGVAVSIRWWSIQVARRPLFASSLMLAPFVVWNGMLMGVYFTGTIPPDGPTSFRQAAGDGLDLFYPRTGYPPSWPAAIRDRLRYGRPLGSYDLSGSLTVSNNVDIRMGDTDALYLGRGWSLPRRGRATTRRIAGHRAEIFFLLNEPAPYRLRFEGRPGSGADVLLNGVPLGEVRLDEEGRAVLTVRADRIISGVNYLVFTVNQGPGLELSRLRLSRGG